jgi:hypothetical protein
MHYVEYWEHCGLIKQAPQLFTTKTEALKVYNRLHKTLKNAPEAFRIWLERIEIENSTNNVLEMFKVEDHEALITSLILLRTVERDRDNSIARVT